MGSLKDIGVILDRFKEMLTHERNDGILHLGCGDGKITFEYLSTLFTKYNTIIGIDASDELIHAATDSHKKNFLGYHVQDITRDSDLENLHNKFKKFHKVVCFSCSSWVKSPKKALENTKTLVREDAELFFAFVGSTPVYDTYEKLAKDPRWAEYMQDYRRYIPFTHYFKDPEAEFITVVDDAGYEVLYCEIMNTVIYRPTVETLNDHILDVNPLVRDIPKAQKADFIRECRESLGRKVNKVLTYKIVILLAKNSRKVLRAGKLDKLKDQVPAGISSSSSDSSEESNQNPDESTTPSSCEEERTVLETSKESDLSTLEVPEENRKPDCTKQLMPKERPGGDLEDNTKLKPALSTQEALG